MRYIGQSHEVSVPVRPEHLDLDTIYADFERLHERFYGTKLEDAAEIVNIRVTVTGQVRTLTDGRYIMYDAGANGMEARIGPTAVLAIGDIRLALRSLPSLEWDTGLYLSVGLDPRRAALVFVKSPSHFRTAYAPLAARILVANTPGPACSDMRQLRFSRVTRPLYPLDAM